ncbi:phospholipase D-like domain-containing protein [Chlamydia vaughanii]|uniref:phospholipase D-like domain-containing protein n=1 Tax=Chlamydia vaughanii TaxID=3112552 RepID=UPI0032B1E412
MNKIRWGLVAALLCSFVIRDASAFTIACPIYGENAGVIVHDNSIEIYEKMLAAIDSAEHYFEFCPCMAGGKILQEVLEHLDARMLVAPNLRSYMLIQPTFIDSQDKQFLANMKAKWPERFFYVFTGCVPGSSILSPNVIEMHVKFSIIDGKYIFLGGTNFEDFMCNRGDVIPEPVDSPRLVVGGMQRPLAFRDQDITIASPILGTALRSEFHAHYSLWKAFDSGMWFNKNLSDFRNLSYPELEVEQASACYCPEIEEYPELITTALQNIRVIISGPDESENAITQEYISLMDQASQSIKIANMYFIPKDEVIESLKSACFHRGVQTQVITNGRTENSPSMTASYGWGNRMNYFFLCYGERPSLWKKYIFSLKKPNPNFSVSEFFIPETQLHKKCMIVDDRFFVIGSYNFGKKSDLFDYESIVVIDSPEVAAKANQVFQKDLTLSKPVSSQEMLGWYFDPIHHLIGHLQINFMPA